MAVIELEDVQKSFTVLRRVSRLRRERITVRAVDGISLSIEAGTMVGYIGPNGAGKSTTVKILTGILVPTAGRVRVAGLEPARQRVELARHVGVVFGQRTQLWWDLPLRDSFDLLRHVYRVPADRHRANVATFVDLLELGPFLDTPVRQLSLGQRMRGDLTAALLHDPDILYLDEPTIGLDVVSKSRVREFLAEVNKQRGVTVVLTTHDLADIERLSQRVIIIDHGQLIYDGDVAELKDGMGGQHVLVVDLEDEVPPIDVARATTVKVEGTRQWLRFRKADTSAAELIARVASQVRLVDLAVHEPDIEDIVQRIYVGETSDAPNARDTGDVGEPSRVPPGPHS